MKLIEGILKDWRTWVILVFGLIMWLLSGCSNPDYLEPPLRLYSVKKGRHDFTPSPLPILGEARTLEGWARLDSSCWYDNLGEDNADWNKLAGVYRWADVAKNKNSFILAWRPDIKIRDVFELCPYENIQGANVPKENVIYKVRAGVTFHFLLDELNGKYTLYVNDKLLGTQANGYTYKVIGKISAWFGGNRKAPHDMYIFMNY